MEEEEVQKLNLITILSGEQFFLLWISCFLRASANPALISNPLRIKHRRRTSPPQLKILEYHFDLNPKPDVSVRKSLSEQLEMTPREVQVWVSYLVPQSAPLHRDSNPSFSSASSKIDEQRSRSSRKRLNVMVTVLADHQRPNFPLLLIQPTLKLLPISFLPLSVPNFPSRPTATRSHKLILRELSTVKKPSRKVERVHPHQFTQCSNTTPANLYLYLILTRSIIYLTPHTLLLLTLQHINRPSTPQQ